MKEEFLHYIWKYKLFATVDLETTDNEHISVLKSGTYNKNAGADFLSAQLKIDDQLWVGNVEIHLKSSDWYVHHHEEDANYEAIILHVVWEHDEDVFMKNNKPLPVLELKDKITVELLENYKKLATSKLSWIPCETEIASVSKFTIAHWLERLYFNRLEYKSEFINELLVQSNNDFEAVLFVLLAKNFGLKVNGNAFFSLSQSIDFSILRKERFDLLKLAALLFGQAGMLAEKIEEVYYITLQQEYAFLKYKYKLVPMAENQFLFFRMRPTNFPTIRIAQLVALLHQHQNLFSKILTANTLVDFYALFSVDVAPFWQKHYTFKTTSKKSPKKLTKSFIDLLLINTIIPLKFTYQKAIGTIDVSSILSLITHIKPEKNGIISKFLSLEVSVVSAMNSQALLELKNNYCDTKRCLECEIGAALLRK